MPIKQNPNASFKISFQTGPYQACLMALKLKKPNMYHPLINSNRPQNSF